jgi:DnaB-like helicase C terminal domain
MSYSTQEIDARPYFQLLHALLRQDGSDTEIARSNGVMDWWITNRSVINDICSRDEMRVIGIVWLGWTEHKVTPTRDTMSALVLNVDQPKVLLDLLEGYDKCVDDLKTLTQADMGYYLNARKKDFEAHKLQAALTQAGIILTGSIPNPEATSYKPLPNLSGTRDALAYLSQRFERGILINDVQPPSGRTADFSSLAQQSRVDNANAAANGKLLIPTGIPIIDQVMGGLRRKQVTGILGYGGQRKTAVLRTMAYNAAKAGFRVLHIPLETDFLEELIAYHVMHTHAQGSFNLPDLNSQRLGDGQTTPAEDAEYDNKVIPDFEATVGRNLQVCGLKDDDLSWTTVRALIERENAKEPLDLVVIDYLTLLGDSSARDDVQAKAVMIKDVKRLTLNSPGYGFAFVTPIQGNRKGYEDAKANDGLWDITGINLYSEMDKSLDNCLYVFTDDAMSSQGKLKIGSCKHRRGANIPSTFVDLNVNAGMVGLAKDSSFRIPAPTAPEKPKIIYDRETFFAFMGPQ